MIRFTRQKRAKQTRLYSKIIWSLHCMLKICQLMTLLGIYNQLVGNNIPDSSSVSRSLSSIKSSSFTAIKSNKSSPGPVIKSLLTCKRRLFLRDFSQVLLAIFTCNFYLQFWLAIFSSFSRFWKKKQKFFGNIFFDILRFFHFFSNFSF